MKKEVRTIYGHHVIEKLLEKQQESVESWDNRKQAERDKELLYPTIREAKTEVRKSYYRLRKRLAVLEETDPESREAVNIRNFLLYGV